MSGDRLNIRYAVGNVNGSLGNEYERTFRQGSNRKRKNRTGIVAGRREYYKCKLGGLGGCEKNKEIKHKQL